MTFTVFEPVSQCSICGLDFPESELVRHYRTGRLVDRLCADERTASDNLAILKRPVEERRRAKQPVPSDEESTGAETKVLSAYPVLVEGVHFTYVMGLGAGTGFAGITGSPDLFNVALLCEVTPPIGTVITVTFLQNRPRPIIGLIATPVSEAARTQPITGNFTSLAPPVLTFATTGSPLTAGQFYEWQFGLRY